MMAMLRTARDISGQAFEQGAAILAQAGCRLLRRKKPAVRRKTLCGLGLWLRMKSAVLKKESSSCSRNAALDTDRFHRQEHARDPLVTLVFTDGKGQ
jgi:hypothetical protein